MLGILGVLMALMTVNVAAKPPTNTSVDPELKRWFESLSQPGTRKPCCSISDCRFVDSIVRDGHYQVQIEGFAYPVPEQAVIAGIANPTGKAVVCYSYGEFRPPPSPGAVNANLQDVAEIPCFVPPRPIS